MSLNELDYNPAEIDTRTPLIPHNTRVMVTVVSEEDKPWRTPEEGGSGAVGGNWVTECKLAEPVDGNIRDKVSGEPMVVPVGTRLTHRLMYMLKGKDGSTVRHWDGQKMKDVTEADLTKHDECFVGQGNGRKLTESSREGETILARVDIETSNEGREYNVIKFFIGE